MFAKLFSSLNIALDSLTDQSYAALDLGSNSFHMIIARAEGNELHVVDRLKEMVRLSAGLDQDNNLDLQAQQRALACLERFGERVKNIPTKNFRAVGTNVLRQANEPGDFLAKAQNALGHQIDIISGIEEARLIFLGVANSLEENNSNRLVIDIGGGSTELIIGKGFKPVHMESLNMGCVSITMQFFSDGEISSSALKRAEIAAQRELTPIKNSYLGSKWEFTIGTSGTIKAVQNVVNTSGWCEHGISFDALKKLMQALKKAGHIDNIRFEGLSKRRSPVFLGGVIILYCIFKTLKIEHMVISDGALREGVLYDLIGRVQHKDVRNRSVLSFAKRFKADLAQAARIEKTVLKLAINLSDAWNLDMDQDAQWLVWAANLHEIGLNIAHDHYHLHGAYIVKNTDLSGFSQQEQSVLAFIIRFHRRKLNRIDFQDVPQIWKIRALQFTILFRIACLLHRSRDSEPLPDIIIKADTRSVTLNFPEGWLDKQPLTKADLEQEAIWLTFVDYKLDYS